MNDSPSQARPGEIPTSEFHRVQQSAEFNTLKSAFRTFAFPMTAVFLVWYFFYVLGSIYAKDIVMTKVLGNITVGLLLGIGQFASTFLITWLYIRHSTKKVDPLAQALREELEGNQS